MRKKKKDGVKNQIKVNNRGIRNEKANDKKGNIQDKDNYKKNHPVTPKDVVKVFDRGYLRSEKDILEQISVLPYKKKRNRQKLSI